MTELEMEKQRQEFIAIWKQHVKRDGADKLLEFLLKSDFFTSPASARYHSAHYGGLCKHSLFVYRRLRNLMIMESETGTLSDEEEESITIVAFCHDLTKIGCYKPAARNQKSYDPEVVKTVSDREPWKVKSDDLGAYVWQSVPGFSYEDPRLLGMHGDTSLLMTSHFMRLSNDEKMAIRWHMGNFQDSEGRNASAAFEKSKLSFLLHASDLFATFLDESRGSGD